MTKKYSIVALLFFLGIVGLLVMTYLLGLEYGSIGYLLPVATYDLFAVGTVILLSIWEIDKVEKEEGRGYIMAEFRKGQKVVVIGEGLKTHGKVCEVIEPNYGRCCRVVLEDRRYSRGFVVITINKENLRILEENSKENEENKIMKKYDKVAMVKFLSGTTTYKEYAFGLFDDVQAGDYVMVDASGAYQLARVSRVLDGDDEAIRGVNITKEVVCKCDDSKFRERRDKENRLKEIKKKMDARLAQLQREKIYEFFAQEDDELKALLKEFKSL